MTAPYFRRHLAPYIVPGEALYLVSESGVAAVHGPLASAVAPLVDGRHSVPDIVDALAGNYPAERVLHAMDQLTRAGYWHRLGIDEPGAGGATVEVHGRADALPVLDAVRSAGVTESADGLVVALTDDYLRSSLADRNAQALASGRPWLLARTVGAVVWVGPLFVPGVTGCWECLAHRLAGNRQSHAYLQRRLELAEPLDTGRAESRFASNLAAHLVAAEVAKSVAGALPGTPAVITLDTATLTSERHEFTRRPQCPTCGSPELVAAQALRPVRFRSVPKVATADGGHRATSADDFVAEHLRTVSPITGVLPVLARVEDGPAVMKTYITGSNLARQAGSLLALRHGLRGMSCGKGMTDSQARASAIGEGIERYSAVFQGDESRLVASYAELGAKAIHPAECMLYSDRQYDQREAWNARGSAFAGVPAPLPDDARIEWSPVWSLTRQEHRYLPTEYLYYSYPRHGSPVYAPADSNGNAAGSSLEDAALQGFLELVERDSVALWWYNRLRRPQLDLDSFGEPYLDRYRADYAAIGREVWALDLTADLGIPAVAALSRRVDKPVEDVLVAFGAHLDPKIALTRALTEMNQFLPAVLNVDAQGRGYGQSDHDQRRWWATATVANSPYLLPDPDAPAVTPARWNVATGTDLADDLRAVQQRVEERGMEMLILDQTRPDLGLPVVKVIVPGMRHFWSRYAPGRLFDVPVALGWQDAPTPEDQLNPVPMFI